MGSTNDNNGDSRFPPLKNDLFLRAIRGEYTERTPVWMMRQAGRYLPEFREVRKQHEFFEVCRTPTLACEITIQPTRRMDVDAAIIFSDILVIPQAMGMEVQMLATKGPHFPNPLTSFDDIDKLISDPEKIASSLTYVYDAITLTRQELQGRVPLIGFSGAPWTLMAYMIEGGGSKTFSAAKRWLYLAEEHSHRLLQMLADGIAAYMIAQVKAGAQALQLFDSWANELTPAEWRTFGAPYIKQIVDKVKAACGEDFPMIIFSKGNYSYALEEFAGKSMHFDVVSIDYTMDPAEARRRVGPEQCLQGNLDPAVLYATPERIRQEVRKMLEQFGTQRYIANLGHGLLPDHDPELVKAFVDAVHEISAEMNQQQKQQQQQ